MDFRQLVGFFSNSKTSFYFRKVGHMNVAYTDNSLLQSDSYDQCLQNIEDKTEFIDSVGLILSELVPTELQPNFTLQVSLV